MRSGPQLRSVLVGILVALVIAGWAADAFRTSFLRSLGAVTGVYLALVAVAYAVEGLSHVLTRMRRCSHGVRRGREGRCRACVAEREEHQARLQAYKVEQERKRKIYEEARALRSSELKRLREAWLSRAELYFEMKPQHFEDAIAELFRELGYEVQQTPYSNDRGKDAIARKDGRKYLIECKRYEASNTIGRRELQVFVAAMKEENAESGFYINTGRFASTAPEYAARNQIELYDRVRFPELVNRAYPIREDVSTTSAMCLEFGAVERLSISQVPTFGTCPNGHQIANEITPTVICNALERGGVCERCGSELRLINSRYRRFWGCSRYPQCKFRRRYHALIAARNG